MTFFQILYSVIIMPLQIFFEYVYSVAQKGLQNPGLSIIALGTWRLMAAMKSTCFATSGSFTIVTLLVNTVCPSAR